MNKDPDTIREMFSLIAPRYNLLNRLMTAGLDRHWRKELVQKGDIQPAAKILDLATGTGDIAFAVHRKHPDAEIVAVDFAMPMLHIGKRKTSHSIIHWCAADAAKLPFPSSTFHVVTSGFLFRNLHDLRQSIREQIRVLKCGGRLLALDSTPPPPSLLRPFIRFYLRHGIPWLGRIFAGKHGASAYRYLPESTLSFRTADELLNLLAEEGLIHLGKKSFLFGTIVLIWGDKEQY
ncbi:MAG: ubiquinone/menaquinone biosynthesis methyltransferase [Chloroflexi bacterium]|nr:ubiquinone/menaquinone biosynthesis methyltransferase [Chloroflexota bacterium]